MTSSQYGHDIFSNQSFHVATADQSLHCTTILIIHMSIHIITQNERNKMQQIWFWYVLIYYTWQVQNLWVFILLWRWIRPGFGSTGPQKLGRWAQKTPGCKAPVMKEMTNVANLHHVCIYNICTIWYIYIYIYALQFSKNGYRYIRDVIYALLWSLVSAHTKVTSTTAISLSMWPQFTWNLFQVHAWLRC